jgi:methylated-DNA-[protein]-cysteine S-methyltransferase
MTTYYTTFESPVGPLLLTSDGARLTGIFMDPPPPAGGWVRRDAAAPFEDARRQLDDYFAGRRTDFDLPLAMSGTEFQRRVWTELRSIPYGTTISYGELAERIGNPNASRAVGLANGRNPLPIVVPCHRVIGANGSLTGYGGGLERKRTLLDLEAAAHAREY